MSTVATIRRWMRDVLSLAVFSVLLMAAIYTVWIAFGGRIAWPSFLREFAVSLAFAFFIGGLSWVAMPRVAHQVCEQHAVIRWAALVATLLGTATSGTALASAVLYYGFGFPGGGTWLGLFRDAIGTSIAITLIAGVVITILETAKGRLQATELALRTQQLERERAEKLAAEAQLASLASRVQPHFLFNTLNSISALVREDPAQAEQMIERLASLLRSSLETAASIPLEQEIKLVGDYLEIQRTRLGPRLRYDLSVAPDAAANVPPFAVQSVVENSLKHVAGQRQEGVAVQVLARRSGGDLVVDVIDDGPGFSPDSMKAGHGLDTLQSRLRALHGEHAALEFIHLDGSMTVRLRLPAT